MSKMRAGPFALLAMAGIFSGPAHALRIDKADYALNLVPYDINIRDYQFPSGLRIVFQEDHTRPIVSVTSVTSGGSKDDPPGMDGFAHLVEHLCFRARHGDLPKNMDLIRQIGGAFNANTWLDRTIYMTIAPRDSLIPLMRLESLRMVDAVNGVSQEVLDVEREVVRNELRGNLEQGPGDIWGNLQAQLFPEDHPYHYTTIGTHEGLNNITLEAIQEWVQVWYKPEHTTIVVTGDFSLDETGDFIQEAFQYEQLVDPANPEAPLELVQLPARIGGLPPEPPPPVSQELKRITGMVDNPTVIIGWSLPGGFRGQDMQWDLTVRMMNVALGKYLFPHWDYENEEIDAFGCFFWPTIVNSMAMCYIEVADEEKAERYVDTALDGLYELWNLDNFYQMERGQINLDGIPIDRYFQYAKLSSMAAIFQTVEDVSNVGGVRAQETPIWLHYTGDPMYYSSKFRELDGVDPRQAAEMAYKYLNRDRHTAVLMVPMDEEEKAKAERKGLEGTYDGITRADQGVLLFEEGELTDDAIERAVVPLDLSQSRHFTMDNGLEVMVVPFGSAPMARAELLFLSGTDNTEPWGLGHMVNKYLEREYSHSVLEFAGSRGGGVGSTDASFSVAGSAGNVRAMITDLREAVETAEVDVSQVGKWIKDTRKARVKDEKKPETWAGRKLWEETFPGHVASRYASDEELEFRKQLKAKDANLALKSWMQPSNAVLMVVGNIDGEQAEADVRELFADWAPEKDLGVSGRAEGVPPAPDPTPRKIYIYPKDGTTQAQVTMMCQLPEPTCENRPSRQVLSSAFTDVLYTELRETAGSTYGAYAYQSELRGGVSFLMADTQIQDKTVDLAISTMLGTIQSIKDEGVDPDKLQTYKWNAGRRVTVGYQTTGQVLGGLDSYASRGCALESTQDFPQQIAAVSNADLQGLLERCVGNEVITIVGTEEDMLREVEEAGFQAEVVDWEAFIEDEDEKKD
jgi:zinc protease